MTSISAGKGSSPYKPLLTSRANSVVHKLSQKIEAAQVDLKANHGKNVPWHNKKRLEIGRLKTAKWLFKNFLTFDFSNYPKYKKWGMTFASPPMGALSLFAFGGLAGWRALRGWQRGVIKDKDGNKIGRDGREVRDVMIRDIWAISVYLWALNILDGQFVKGAERKLGMKLTHGGNSLAFSDIEDSRTLYALKNQGGKDYTGPNAVRKMAANLLNGDGPGLSKATKNIRFFGIPQTVFKLAKNNDTVMKALDGMALNINAYQKSIDKLSIQAEIFLKKEEQHILKSSEGKSPKEIADLIKNQKASRLERFVQQHGESIKGSQTILKDLDGARRNALKDLFGQGKSSDLKINKFLDKYWPEYASYGARASKQTRVLLSDIPAFATVLLLIGILPVQFNQWYTNKEYGKLKEQTNRLRGFAFAMDNTDSPLSRRVMMAPQQQQSQQALQVRA